MRSVLLTLLAVVLAPGADIGLSIPVREIVHPVRAWRSASVAKRWLAVADGLLESANAVDYITTRRGAFPGTGGCELNPLLTKAPCEIDVARFSAIKLAIAAFGAVQWAPVGSGTFIPVVAIVDMAIALPLAIADGNNVVQLIKK